MEDDECCNMVPDLRMLALGEAIRSSNSLASTEEIVERAEKFLEFLKGEDIPEFNEPVTVTTRQQ